MLALGLVELVGCPAADDPAVDTFEQAIIGGDSSEEGEYPATGALVRGRTLTCTATLIAPDVVITAAHCLVDEGWGDLFFTLDPDLTKTIDNLVPVLVYHQHPEFHVTGPDYAKMGKRNDLGIAILEEPIEGVAVEQLDTRAYLNEVSGETELTLCGYGRDYWSTSRTAGIKRDAVVFVDAANSWELRTTNEDPQPCKGDSGGPLFVETSEGRRVAGLVSRASGTSNMCDSGAIYTRVSPYVDWVEQASNDRDTGACSTGGAAGGAWPALLGWLFLVIRRRRALARPSR